MNKKRITKQALVFVTAGGFALLCLMNLSCRSQNLLLTDERTDKIKDQRFASWLERDFSSERQLLGSIRNSLVSRTQIDKLPSDLNIDLEPDYAWVSITLFEPGREPLRWISKKKTGLETINRIIERLLEDQRLSEFNIADNGKCRIMLEVIIEEHPVDIRRLNTKKFDKNRFEPGITGFKVNYNGQVQIYMPTDAAVYGHMTITHVLNHLSKKLGIAGQTLKISKRMATMKKLPIEWSLIKGAAFITCGDDILPLYRGYPVPVEFSAGKVSKMVKSSAFWLDNNMTDDGKFLYYYDGVLDSVIDHVHPARTEENNYYNILRHSGGVLALLRSYELTKRQSYLTDSEKALDFLVKNIQYHNYKGKKACYVFFNKKAKLGGTGIGLTALMRYRQITGSTKYDDYIFGMANHLLSRIDDDGEMIGYYIHPQFNNGKPITSPSPEEERQLFSFYYPGEALLGLALFEQEMNMTDDMRREVQEGAKKALDFLIHIRPVRYADMFEPLPSDGWLMQAIEEWSRDSEFQKREYLDFVFNDANQLISHMYNYQNSPYYDYPGSFYYHYGDHAYVDSARGEGLISAYYLAARIGNEKLASNILDNCITVATSLMYSYNSAESVYMHKYPAKSIGSFRFKLTRHWVRVDTAQHAICFYTRLLSAMEGNSQKDK